MLHRHRMGSTAAQSYPAMYAKVRTPHTRSYNDFPQLDLLDSRYIGAAAKARLPHGRTSRLQITTIKPASLCAQGQALPEDVAFDIEKDVNRTFPEMARCGAISRRQPTQRLSGPHEQPVARASRESLRAACARRFATGKGVQSLMNILKAYAALDPEVGYCQGMNFLAGVLLMYLPSEADAYGALVVLMQQRGLRELYKTDLAWLQVRPWLNHQWCPITLALTSTVSDYGSRYWLGFAFHPHRPEWGLRSLLSHAVQSHDTQDGAHITDCCNLVRLQGWRACPEDL